jgi:hypothetical protein
MAVEDASREIDRFSWIENRIELSKLLSRSIQHSREVRVRVSRRVAFLVRQPSPQLRSLPFGADELAEQGLADQNACSTGL